MAYKRNHSKLQSEKTKFRRTSKWMKFRKMMKAAQVVDPITGSRLSPTCNLHHKDLNPDHYTDISNKERFVCLNKTSHDVVHFLWQSHCGWRKAVLSLIAILKSMEQINKM